MTKDTVQAYTVEIFDKSTRLGTADVDANGNWRFDTSALEVGGHIFRAQAGEAQSTAWNLTVSASDLTLPLPHIRNANLVAEAREQINYYAHQGSAFVEIPDYGMQPGDTVRVEWVGRKKSFRTEVKTVENPPKPIFFEISMYEVIDCIGTNATIKYTVLRPPAGKVNSSPSLILTVNGHVGAITAPTINTPDNNNILVQFQNGYYSAAVRFIGLTTVESSTKRFEGKYIDFPINAAWLNANRGQSVLFNYSLKLFDNQEIFYSQILRVANL